MESMFPGVIFRIGREGAMSRQSQILDRVTGCERLMQEASDTGKQTAFRMLREMWIALANESYSMSSEVLSKEIAAIEEMQAAVVGGRKTTNNSSQL
jgi:hypothetical protein